MTIVVASPVRAVADAICHARGELLEEELRSAVTRSPGDLLQHLQEAAVILVDANLVSHATWLDVNGPASGGAHLVVFGVGRGLRDLCFCRTWNAEGLVGEGATLAELAEATSAVASGRFFIAPSAAGLIRKAAVIGREHGKPRLLTRREQEVANLLSFGGSNSSIATHLGISVETARIHVKHIARKLEVVTRAAIADRYVSYIAAEYELLCGIPRERNS